jgi:Ca2+-binding RTX toxin-like protein
MAQKFIATAAAETFVNPFHTVNVEVEFNGTVVVSGDLGSDAAFIPIMIQDSLLEGTGHQNNYDVYADNSVDYSLSTSAVSIDLRPSGFEQNQAVPQQSGGFAHGDVLQDIFEVTGTNFDDVIRGSDPYADVFNNPGDNVLIGGGGSDVLEGRGGADVLIGGSFDADFSIDYASYESSPAAVTVRLAGVGSDTQTAIATGGDAAGDTLVGIEGLIGSRFDDHLTGNSLNNILAGGLGNDVLDGKGGIDTADYSRDHFYDSFAGSFDSADEVVVKLGLNGANGTGAEFKFTLSTFSFQQVSVDTLISIENVTGTAGSDAITGNEQDNVLDGRGGNDTLDGGFGNDTLIGGSGNDTASYLSHDVAVLPTSELDIISLGLNGSNGSFVRSELSRSAPPQIVETDVLSGIENVTGSNRSETITGNEQNNVLDGRGGNDVLDGGFGNDTLIGGDGIDTASYASHDSVVLATPGVTIVLGINGADGSATDTFSGHGFTTVETDILRGIENVSGSNHDDIIIGNQQDNVLDGRGGNDQLDGGLGNDTLIGGGGFDTAIYFSHDSLPLLPGEQDVISLGLNGADGSYTRSGLVSLGSVSVFQVVEHDVLRDIAFVIGSNRAETINGNEQDNALAGRGGDDNLNGGAGNDIYNYQGSFGVAFGNDRIFDDSGTDSIRVDSFSDILNAQRTGNDLILTLANGTIQIVDHFGTHQVENIVDANGNSMVLATGLIGGNLPGIIAGGDGGETLDGKGGDDFLFGGKGNDRLIGGDGNDQLTGGKGHDTFVFGPGFGHDVIADFSHADRIEFDGGVFRNFHEVLAASHQVGNNTVITLDSSNSITLEGVALHSLHAHDFLLS